MPPLCRGHMTPEHIDRKPWQAFLARVWTEIVLRAAPVLNTSLYQLALLDVMLALLILFGLRLGRPG